MITIGFFPPAAEKGAAKNPAQTARAAASPSLL